MGPEDFHYDLPVELIAQRPTTERGASRLMILERRTGRIRHEAGFSAIEGELAPGDLLVTNDTRVIPARLIGRKPAGGAAEVFLVRRLAEATATGKGERWEAFVKGVRRAREGFVLSFDGGLVARLVSRAGDDGLWTVELSLVAQDCGTVAEALARIGRTPLPPYIKREPEEADRERYQTVFAARDGAVAAPTAGLHFTGELLDCLRAKGVKIETLTLHTGPGTFLPVRARDVREHRMHAEEYEIPATLFDDVRRTRRAGGRVVAVGTTTTRALETAALGDIDAPILAGSTDIFIYPGFEFRAVDGMITNFHLPGSTLLMLVCAFAGTENVLSAYAEAVRGQYRFYSYGDAMLII